MRLCLSRKTGDRKRNGRRMFVGGVALAALLMVVAAACAPLKPPPSPSLITTNPAMFPAYSNDVIDYVSRCSASAPVQVSVNAPSDTTVSVNGQPFQSGSFTVEVTRDVGQSFTIVVQSGSQPPVSHYVRCLPGDFPNWIAQRSGQPQAEWYVTTTPFSGLSRPNYPVIFDSNGVPVWWSGPTTTVFTTLLPGSNGSPDVAWTFNDGSGAEVHALDGSLVQTVSAVGGSTDLHDLLLLPNGDYVVVADVARAADLSACGGAANGTLIDQDIQEINPQGVVVWHWDTNDHIPVSETDPQWYSPCSGSGDAYHWNSIEWTGSGFVVSYRHLDAVYEIDQPSGNIVWKLGGSSRPESLNIVNDPVFDSGSHLGGQHDARLLSDGSVTLHDDGTNLGRPPRAVRYAIDTTAKTATFQEQVTDPLVSSSTCCGSARKLSGGDWVMGWGASPVLTEMTDSGSRVFLVDFGSGLLYRGVPVSFGQVSRDALRAGMDAQFHTPPVGATNTAVAPATTSPPRRAPTGPNPGL